MFKMLIAAIAVLATTAGPVEARELTSVEWTIDGIASRNGEVQLALRDRHQGGNSNWSSGYAFSELAGLSPGLINSGASSLVRFSLVREAGRLDCGGNAGNRRGAGTCRFTPDASFASLLASRGVGRPDSYQSYQLTMSGSGRALLDALAANRYPTPTIKQMVAMGIHGVTPAFVRSLADTGYRLGSVDDLVTFRIHGVSPDYIRAITAAGPQFRGIAATDLVTFRIHGVSPDLVRNFARLGYRPDRKDIVAMQIHGVTPAFVEALAALGYRGLESDDLVQMRIFGVTPEYIQSLRRAGINLPPADQLVRLRMSGFKPRAN